MRWVLAWLDRWFFTIIFAMVTGANAGSGAVAVSKGDTWGAILYGSWALTFIALFVWELRKALRAYRYTITLQSNDRATAERAVAALKKSGVAK
jgi:hypothetical protein